MEEYLRFLISPLLSHPDLLHVTINGPIVVLSVAEDDMGRVIGKHGATINSLRTLLRTYCALHQLPPSTLTLAEAAAVA